MPSVEIRGLAGSQSLQFDSESITISDVREAAGLNDGLVLRLNGVAASDDTPVEDDAVIVATAPAAKHGA